MKEMIKIIKSLGDKEIADLFFIIDRVEKYKTKKWSDAYLANKKELEDLKSRNLDTSECEAHLWNSQYEMDQLTIHEMRQIVRGECIYHIVKKQETDESCSCGCVCKSCYGPKPYKRLFDEDEAAQLYEHWQKIDEELGFSK